MPRKTRKDVEEKKRREKRFARSRRHVPARAHVHYKDWAGEGQRKIEEKEKEIPR